MQETVTKIQFTDNDPYYVMQPNSKKKLFKCYLEDPEPALPPTMPDFFEDDITPGDYVLVNAESITVLEKTVSKYVFDPAHHLILTEDWEMFEEVPTHSRIHTHAKTHTRHYQLITST